MKNYFYSFLILTISFLLLACNNNNQKIVIENAYWLIGQWKNSSLDGVMYEIWEKKNDSLYLGKSYMIKDRDTLWSETMRLEQKGEQLFFIPTVKDQNGGQPVEFALTSFTENQLIFENPKHDFPQKITYTQIKKDSLLAEISGIYDGKQKAEQFPMTKIH